MSRARRSSARRAWSQPDSREPAIHHGSARGVQLRLDRGPAGQDLTTSIQRVRGTPRGRFQPNEPGSKSRIAREGWCGGKRSTSIPADPAAGSQRGGRGLSGKGPHRFIGDEVAPVNAKNRSESPTVKPGEEGSNEARSPRRTTAQAGLQHCICASWWYAKWTAGATMACRVPASHLTIVRVCARFRV